MNQMFRSEAFVKHLAEEVCEQDIDGLSIGWCGDLAHAQCGSCTKFICPDHAVTCKTCRDLGKHYLYCPNCTNGHKHEDVP